MCWHSGKCGTWLHEGHGLAGEVRQFSKMVTQYLPPLWETLCLTLSQTALWFCHSHVKRWGLFLPPPPPRHRNLGRASDSSNRLLGKWHRAGPDLAASIPRLLEASCYTGSFWNHHAVERPSCVERWEETLGERDRDRPRRNKAPDMEGRYLGCPATNGCSHMADSMQEPWSRI